MEPKLRFKEFSGDWKKKNTLELIKDKKGSIKIGPFGSSLKKEYFIDKGIKVYAQENIFKKDFSIGNYYISSKKYEELRSCQLEEGDLVISMMGTIGSCAIFPKNAQIGIMNSHLLRLQFKDNIDTRIIEQQLRSSENIKHQIDKLSVGSIMSGLSSSVVKKLIFYLPSFPEQTKIADFLLTVDEKIQNQQDKITHLENIKKGFMQKIFSRKIRFKDANGNEFPEWEEKKLKDIGEFIRGLSYSTKDVIDNENGLLIIRSNNIIPFGKTDYKNKLQFVKKSCKDNQILKKGDITICMANGSNALVGKASYYDGNYNNPITVGAFCGIYRSKFPIVRYLFQIEKYKKYLSIILNGGDGAIANLKGEDILNLKFKLPCLEEQQKIANFLSSFDEKIDVEKEILEHLKELKKGLLQQMFV